MPHKLLISRTRAAFDWDFFKQFWHLNSVKKFPFFSIMLLLLHLLKQLCIYLGQLIRNSTILRKHGSSQLIFAIDLAQNIDFLLQKFVHFFKSVILDLYQVNEFESLKRIKRLHVNSFEALVCCVIMIFHFILSINIFNNAL